MTRTTIFALVSLVWLVACSQPSDEPPPAEPAPEPVEPEPGATPSVAESEVLAPSELRYQPFDAGMGVFDGEIAGTRVVLVRVDPRIQPLELFADQDKRHPGRSTQYVLKVTGARAALSGGFLQSFSPAIPLGFVQADGAVVNRPHRAELFNGVIRLAEGSVDVLRVAGEKEILGLAGGRAGSRSDEDTDYLQSGPLIVFDGRPALELADPELVSDIEGAYGRAFFCVDAGGNAILGATGEIRLDALAPILARPNDDGGVGCAAAVNLSGASSRSLIADGDRGTVEIGQTGFRNATVIVAGRRR